VNSTLAALSQGILPLPYTSECLSGFMLVRSDPGSFDSVSTSLREVLTPLRMTDFD